VIRKQVGGDVDCYWVGSFVESECGGGKENEEADVRESVGDKFRGRTPQGVAYLKQIQLLDV